MKQKARACPRMVREVTGMSRPRKVLNMSSHAPVRRTIVEPESGRYPVTTISLGEKRMPVPSAFETASLAHQKRRRACEVFGNAVASAISSGMNTPVENSSERFLEADSASTPTRAFDAAIAMTNCEVWAMATSSLDVRWSPHAPIA